MFYTHKASRTPGYMWSLMQNFLIRFLVLIQWILQRIIEYLKFIITMDQMTSVSWSKTWYSLNLLLSVECKRTSYPSFIIIFCTTFSLLSPVDFVAQTKGIFSFIVSNGPDATNSVAQFVQIPILNKIFPLNPRELFSTSY